MSEFASKFADCSPELLTAVGYIATSGVLLALDDSEVRENLTNASHQGHKVASIYKGAIEALEDHERETQMPKFALMEVQIVESENHPSKVCFALDLRAEDALYDPEGNCFTFWHECMN